MPKKTKKYIEKIYELEYLLAPHMFFSEVFYRVCIRALNYFLEKGISNKQKELTAEAKIRMQFMLLRNEELKKCIDVLVKDLRK